MKKLLATAAMLAAFNGAGERQGRPQIHYDPDAGMRYELNEKGDVNILMDQPLSQPAFSPARVCRVHVRPSPRIGWSELVEAAAQDTWGRHVMKATEVDLILNWICRRRFWTPEAWNSPAIFIEKWGDFRANRRRRCRSPTREHPGRADAEGDRQHQAAAGRPGPGPRWLDANAGWQSGAEGADSAPYPAPVPVANILYRGAPGPEDDRQVDGVCSKWSRLGPLPPPPSASGAIRSGPHRQRRLRHPVT